MRKQITLLLVFLLLGMFYPNFTQAQGSSYVVIDAKSGRILAGSGEHEKLPIASLTKIWTAVVVAEEVDLKETTKITPHASSQEGSSIYLKSGADTPIDVLLYGLMLRSGNDAAVALAEHAGGSVEGFVKLMNEKAILMGLKNTEFQNPSGLPHEKHMSTAYDTALMLKIAMENKELKTIFTTKNYNQNGLSWENKHRLVKSEPSAIAGKTGFTKAAGRTLATYFKNDKEEVIVVTLNQSNDWKVHKQLAQNAFTQYDRVQVIKKGSYDLPGGLVIKPNHPVFILKKKNEQLSHVIYLSRKKDLKNIGRWDVQLNGQTIITQKVHIERNE